MMLETESEDDPGLRIGLSFIDIVCGGFGAAFFLFLVFATLPLVESSARGGSSSFLHIEVEWDQPVLQLGLVVEFEPTNDSRPDVTMDFRFQNLWPITSESGSLDTSGHGDRQFFSSGWVVGSSVQRDRVLIPRDSASHRATVLRLSNPCPGTYAFFIVPHGTTNDVQDDTAIYRANVFGHIIDASVGGKGQEEITTMRVTRQPRQTSPRPVRLDHGNEPLSVVVRRDPTVDQSHCA